MIEKIIEGSARNTFLVVLFIALTTVVGLWALQNTPLDAYTRSVRCPGHHFFGMAGTCSSNY